MLRSASPGVEVPDGELPGLLAVGTQAAGGRWNGWNGWNVGLRGDGDINEGMITNDWDITLW